jgi:hypothetical protein
MAVTERGAHTRAAQMKFGIALLAALTFVACCRIAAAGEIDRAVVVKVADQAVLEPAPRLRRHRYVVRPYVVRPPADPYPAACESVFFPRSPQCAGRPAAFGPYAPYPWDRYVSY